MGAKEWVRSARYAAAAYLVREAGPTCQIQCERDEAVVASQELQRFLSLHQGAEVICHSFPVEKVVDANQEVPDRGGKRGNVFIFLVFTIKFQSVSSSAGSVLYAALPLELRSCCTLTNFVCVLLREVALIKGGEFQLAFLLPPARQ